MPMQLVPLTEYTFDQLRIGLGLDGPCVMPDGTFALLVSLRGKDGGAMPSPSELHWPRDVPDKLRTEPAHLFLRRDGEEARAIYLGKIAFVKTGRPARDGFRILFRLMEPLPDATWRELVAAANAPAAPPPEEAIAALTSRSTTADRIHALRVFVERWYGAATSSSSAVTPPVEVPEALRRLHELAATRPIFGQNELVMPRDLVVNEGKLVFYVENQGVCEWAIEPGSNDPPVLVRSNAPGDPWREDAPTLSGFLIQAVLFETVLCAARFSASTDGADAAELRKLKRHAKPIALPPWADRTEFLAANGLIGFVVPDADLFRIELAAHDRAAFAPIEELVADWPNLGF